MLLSRLVLLGGLITPWNLATAEKEVRTETKEKEVTLTAQIVLVAVGPKAPRRFKNTGTHASSVMLLPEPGEVPPSRLYFKLSHPLMKNRIGRHSMWLLTTPR